MNVEMKASSEHHSKLRVMTVLIIMMPTSCFIISVVGIPLAIYMGITKEIPWGGTVFVCVLGSAGAFGFGCVVLKFAARMLAVKTVHVLTEQQLEITTRTNRKYTAKLPDQIRYAITDRGFLTIAVGIGVRVFVIDSAEYSNSEQLNQFFQQFANGPK